MSKFWVIVIIGIIVFGLFFYFKPEKTKNVTENSIDKISSIIKNLYENREINLGKPNLPCNNNEDCNNYIEDCENRCICVSGDCIKNVQE